MARGLYRALSELKENPELTADEVARLHNSNIKWDRELKEQSETEENHPNLDEDNIRKVAYRPFIKLRIVTLITFLYR